MVSTPPTDEMAPAAAALSRYAADAPIALVTDFPPDAPGGGAVILRSLLGPEDRARVAWMTLTPPAAAAGPGVIPLAAATAARGRRSLLLDSTVRAGAIAREVAERAAALGARAAWVVMHGAAVHVAARLVGGPLPLHLTVHDDPAYANALRSRRYLALTPWIARDFARAMRGARSVDVIGPGMASRYRRLYGVEATIVHRGLPGPVGPAPAYDRDRLGLRVGVLGSTYSYAQMPALARAVAGAARAAGVPGSVLVLGRGHGERLRAEMKAEGAAVEVEAPGHVDEAEGVRRLRGCFALYLNYPFGRRDAVLRQTSFPTKLSTYVQAARPLLVHAPADSSVAHLAAENPGYAAHWASTREADGRAALAALWDAPAPPDALAAAAEGLRKAHYDPGRNRAALFAALDGLVPAAGGR